jgi:hypothetical protein
MIKIHSPGVILAMMMIPAKVSQGYVPNTVWSDIQVLQEQVHTVKQKMRQHHDNIRRSHDSPHHRSLQFRQVCDAIIELFDAVAPQNENRVCDCNFLGPAITCKYEDLICSNKTVPNMEITVDLGLAKTSVEICQGFQDDEFGRVCIDANLDNTKYDTCTKATMGEGENLKECECTVCEGGKMLQLDCTASHPLAVTQGCQRIFFDDTCLDFAPVAMSPDSNVTKNLTGRPSFGNASTATSRQFTAPTERDILNDDDLVYPAMPTPQEMAENWTQNDPKVHPSNKLTQRFAMASLYYATTIHGSEWFRQNNWLSYDVDECSWYSNSSSPCSAKGDLEILKIPDNQMLGSLVPEIGTLTTLKQIDLSVNSLSGPLPTTIGSLTNLKELNLFGTGLYGTIPTQLGNLTNLMVSLA